jgi:penicillin-binding protein 1A
MDADSPVADTPLRVGDWQPKNYESRYRGTLTLKEALALSSNVAAVRLSERVGRDNVIRAARDLGVTSPLANHPSLALGTSGTTLLEITAAYAAVAAGSYPVRPHGLEDEEQSWWQSLWHKSVGEGATRSDPAFSDLREMLGAVVQQGTGRGAALDVPAYGKTGTTQDSRDALFIGFTEDLVVGVWVGNDDNSPLGNVAGGGLPARIWRDFMTQAVGTTPAKALAPPIAAQAPVQVDQNGISANLTVPLEGTGYDVGVTVGEDGVTLSTNPSQQPGGPQDERPGERPIPTVNIPPPPPEPEDLPPEEGE